MKRLVVGLDPGLVSSPTGFVAFDPDSKNLLHTQEIRSSEPEQWRRIKDIASQVEEGLAAVDPELELLVYCESFVLRGKAGEMLARLTGSLMAAVPAQAEFGFVANTTVKKVVGGHGRAEKPQVAAGVHHWASGNGLTQEAIERLIRAQSWDVLDAFAIGIAGFLRDHI